MDEKYLISDAAKMVQVESHVLRYWEEELELPIQRNGLGHRFYTKEDVERFRKIKNLKERGLQLRAIKMILKGGKLEVLEEGTLISQLMLQSREENDLAVMNKSQGENDLAVMNKSQGENDLVVMNKSQGENDDVVMNKSQGENNLVVKNKSQGENDDVVMSESQGEKCSGVTIGSQEGKGIELTSEEMIERGGGMAIEILEVRDLGKEQAEVHRGEEYFKRLDQMLRDKCTTDKKKRHFIF